MSKCDSCKWWTVTKDYVDPYGERYCPLDCVCDEEHDKYTDLTSSCSNCGQDRRYCETENQEKYGFCGNWSEIKGN